jgi:hypothetical protein
MKVILILLLAVTPGVVSADTVTSHRDTMGYTHSTITSNGKQTHCISQKNTMGYTITRCN